MKSGIIRLCFWKKEFRKTGYGCMDLLFAEKSTDWKPQRIFWERRLLMKEGKVIFLLFCTLFFLYGCNGGKKSIELDEPVLNPGICVVFFDVGKGDAILIRTQEDCMLIDTGYDETREVILNYLAEQKIEKLDYLVLTHFDKDHVGGADHILKEVEVGKVLQPDYESDSDQYQEYCQVMKDKKMEPVYVTETTELSLNNAEILIYPPQKNEYKEEDNDFSLVISLRYGKRRFLFTGDCERERLNELLEQKEFDLAHDVLKVPHHGRKEKNSVEFLAAVSPEAAVITCSEEKMTDKEIIKALKGLGTKIYLTLEGTVTVLCDGNELTFKQ